MSEKPENTVKRWEKETGLKAILPSFALLPAAKERDSSQRYMFCLNCRRWILVEFWFGHFEKDCDFHDLYNYSSAIQKEG